MPEFSEYTREEVETHKKDGDLASIAKSHCSNSFRICVYTYLESWIMWIGSGLS